jgi:hypothetical protein
MYLSKAEKILASSKCTKSVDKIYTDTYTAVKSLDSDLPFTVSKVSKDNGKTTAVRVAFNKNLGRSRVNALIEELEAALLEYNLDLDTVVTQVSKNRFGLFAIVS